MLLVSNWCKYFLGSDRRSLRAAWDHLRHV